MPMFMNNDRTHSAVQANVANPAWGDVDSDRLGYDGAGRMITKRYLSGGIDGETGAYNDPTSIVGFTTSFEKASNKFYERHLHAESRSNLYQPRDQDSGGVDALGYDSIDRLRQYQRGVLNDGTGGSEGTVPGCQIAPSGGITLPNAKTQQTYALNGLGNWKNTTFTPVGDAQIIERRDHNHLNQITATKEDSDPKVLFSYDGTPGASNGNLENDGTRLYKYDAFNRLIEVYKDPNGTPVLIGSYVYDALGRRVRKFVVNGGLSGSIPNGLTHYLFAPGSWRVIEEINAQIQTLKQYVWGIYLDELIQQKQVAALNNFSAGDELYPLQDLLYRTTGLADDAGTVREAYDCDAYGNTLIFRNSGSPPAAIAYSDSDTQVDYPTCEAIFTGQRWDAETANYSYGARCYSPQWGRFVSRDVPAELRANLYRYASLNPVARVDPSGQEDYKEVLPPDAPPKPVCDPGCEGTAKLVRVGEFKFKDEIKGEMKDTCWILHTRKNNTKILIIYEYIRYELTPVVTAEAKWVVKCTPKKTTPSPMQNCSAQDEKKDCKDKESKVFTVRGEKSPRVEGKDKKRIGFEENEIEAKQKQIGVDKKCPFGPDDATLQLDRFK